MVSREQIIEELKRIAEYKGSRSISEEDFERHSTIPISTLRFFLGSWQRALKEAGFLPGEAGGTAPIAEVKNDDELLKELIRLYEESGELPSLAMIQAKGKYGDRPYRDRWKSIDEAFQEAKRKFPVTVKTSPQINITPPKPRVNPREKTGEEEKKRTLEFHDSEEVELLGEMDMTDDSKGITPQKIMFIPQTIKPQKDKVKPRLPLEPIDFRGLRFAPATKAGVLYLFGLVNQELGFLIESFINEFPDCEGERCIDPEKNLWERVRIQLEYKSSDLKTRISTKSYDDSQCDLIVCWTHDWLESPIEVLELRSTIQLMK